MEEGKYGPLSSQVARLVATTDKLTNERFSTIAEAFQEAGWPVAKQSMLAAEKADRWIPVHTARKDMAMSVIAFGLATGADEVRLNLVMRAAGNAGVALATEDLIGTLGYTSREYHDLVRPWLAGFPMDEGEI